MGVILEKKFELSILLTLVVFDILFASIAIYIFEGGTGRGNPNLITFFDAVYWSIVTIATVGYGDISPISTEGRVVAIVLIMSGIAMIAFTTSIVTSALAEKMTSIKEDRHRRRALGMRECVVVCGFGRIGRHVMEELTRNRFSCVVLEKNIERVDLARSMGFTALCADATHTEDLMRAGIEKEGRTLVCVADKDLTNLYIALTARSLNEKMKIIAKANDLSIAKKFELVGVNHTVSMYELSTFIAAEYLGKPVAFEAIEDIILSNDDVQIDEVTVRYDDPMTLQELECGEYGVVLIGIWRDGKFMFNPSFDVVVHDNDVLIIMGRPSGIAKVGAKIFALGKR
jgi:voltage-gated potassium channel